MTSFTKQLRAGTGAFARENIEQAPEMTPAEVETTLAEPLGAEIEQEVVAPVAEIEAGNDALVEAEADATTLENTANIVEGAIGDGSADVDVATSELANITVERIATKYNLPRAVTLSKEAFGTAENRKVLAKQISKEAFEKGAELRKRVSDGIAKIIEWFKNLIKSVFDKRAKLEKRLQAITQLAKQRKGHTAKDGVKISGHSDAIDVKSTDINSLIASLVVAEDIAKSSAGEINDSTNSGVKDLNPKLIGGVKLTVSVVDGKVIVEKEKIGDRPTVEKDVPSVEQIYSSSINLQSVLRGLKDAETDFNKIVEAMGTTVQKLKNLATGKEDGEQIERSKILARYQAVSTIGGTLSAIVLTVLSEATTALEQSIAAYETPAA